VLKANNKIRGLSYEEIYSDGIIMWLVRIRNPFFKEGRWWFSLNDKLFEVARMRGVKKFIVQVGQKEVTLPVLTPLELQTKEIKGEVEKIPSKFAGLPPWKRYLFPI